MIIPCGVSKSVTELIVFRFFGALAGSAMISCAPGSVSDIVDDEHRALAFSIWSIGPFNGPGNSFHPFLTSRNKNVTNPDFFPLVFGPIVGGFVTQYLGWRWTNWICLMLGGVAFIFSCIMKETYTPVLLQKKAARIRKESDDERWWSRYDQKQSLSKVLKVNLCRPFVMAIYEPIW